MKRNIAYLKYVLRHKWFVFLACVKLKVPLYLAIFHDFSKFGFVEFDNYAKTFFDKNGKQKGLEVLSLRFNGRIKSWPLNIFSIFS